MQLEFESPGQTDSQVGASLSNEVEVSEVFSLPITKPYGRPPFPFDWLIHSGLIILARCHTIVESDGRNFLFY